MAQRRWQRWLSLSAMLVLLASFALVGVVQSNISSSDAQTQALIHAESQWARRPFEHYRVVLKMASWCQSDVEVENERITQVYENTCPDGPRTVSDVFGQIQRLASSSEQVYCAPDGCECTEVRHVVVDYDSAYGFPEDVRIRRARAPNWHGLWEHIRAHGLPNCLPPRDQNVFTILSFQPLT